MNIIPLVCAAGESVRDVINRTFDEIIILEPADYDKAILGYVMQEGENERWGTSFDKPTPALVYDEQVMLEILMADGMDYDEAAEFFSFNIEGAYLGPTTPCFKSAYDEEDFDEPPAEADED